MKKFSQLHVELMKMREDTDERRRSNKRVEKTLPKRSEDARYNTADEYFKEDSVVAEEEEFEEEEDSDIEESDPGKS